MILVITGFHYQNFNRLVKGMDKIGGDISEKVIIQIGHSTYVPQHARWFKFKDDKEIEQLIKKSRVIVSHAGAGTILSVLKYKKPLIIFPRLKKYKEHEDNHQLEITEALAKEKRIIPVYNISKLKTIVKRKKFNLKVKNSSSGLVTALKKAIVAL